MFSKVLSFALTVLIIGAAFFLGKRNELLLILEKMTITPWILGTLSLLAAFALVVVVKSWRDMKRSPYFFLRQQAAQKLQTYSLTSLLLIGATLATAVMTLQKPPDETIRVATIANAKPVTNEIRSLVAATPDAEADGVDTAVSQTPISTQDLNPLTVGSTELLEIAYTLPEEYDQFEPSAQLLETTELGRLLFSTEISNEYEAISPANIFAEGSYTLYATFDYDAMQDGMVWSWVWRHEGDVVSGGNEFWNYGADGPGFIYFNPEEGFQSGDYSLEVWVNGELLTQSDLTINTAAVSAGN